MKNITNRLFPWLYRATCIVITLSALQAQAADIVKLANGDQLTGSVVSKLDNVLKLQTDYAGVISIQWAHVVGLESTTAVRLILDDDTRIKGALQPSTEGSVQVSGGEMVQATAIPLHRIVYINPPPELIGEGVKSKGRINAGFNIAEGNTENQRLHLDSEAVIKSLRNRYTLGGIYNRTTDSNGVETEDNATAYAKYDHFIDKKWYLYANTLFARDDLKDLKLRSSLGLGSGYQFFESDALNLSLEAGVNYINEDYSVGEDSEYPSLRWSINYDQLLLGTNLQFFHFHEAYLGLEDTEDALLRSQTGLRMPIWQRLMVTAQFDYDWDNTPAPGKERVDQRYLLNLGYKW